MLKSHTRNAFVSVERQTNLTYIAFGTLCNAQMQ